MYRLQVRPYGAEQEAAAQHQQRLERAAAEAGLFPFHYLCFQLNFRLTSAQLGNRL